MALQWWIYFYWRFNITKCENFNLKIMTLGAPNLNCKEKQRPILAIYKSN